MVQDTTDNPPCEADDEPETCACSERVAVLEAQMTVMWVYFGSELSRQNTALRARFDANMELAGMGGDLIPQPKPPMPVCTDPDCTIPRKPGRPPHGPHDFRAKS